MASKRRTSQRGQALVEFVLILPLVVLLAFGGEELGRAFSLAQAVDDISRAGMRIGIDQDIYCPNPTSKLNCGPNLQGGTSDTDIGAAIRGQTASSLNLLWGQASSYAAYGAAAKDDNCTNNRVGTCGDPQGCAPSSSFWTDNSMTASAEPATACFAVRTCYLHNGSCVSYDAWGSRPSCAPPTPPANVQCWQTPYTRTGLQTFQELDVRVVAKFQVEVPFLYGVIGSKGTVYLTRDAVAPPLY